MSQTIKHIRKIIRDLKLNQAWLASQIDMPESTFKLKLSENSAREFSPEEENSILKVFEKMREQLSKPFEQKMFKF